MKLGADSEMVICRWLFTKYYNKVSEEKIWILKIKDWYQRLLW